MSAAFFAGCTKKAKTEVVQVVCPVSSSGGPSPWTIALDHALGFCYDTCLVLHVRTTGHFLYFEKAEPLLTRECRILYDTAVGLHGAAAGRKLMSGTTLVKRAFDVFTVPKEDIDLSDTYSLNSFTNIVNLTVLALSVWLE